MVVTVEAASAYPLSKKAFDDRKSHPILFFLTAHDHETEMASSSAPTNARHGGGSMT